MRSHIYLAVLGIISFILYLWLTGLSKDFNWGEGYSERPILEYLAIYFALFFLYTLACFTVFKSNCSKKAFWILAACG
ncbi:uncharacterized protein METZ01_LOCUS286979, partial [marine metagenome]